MTQARDVEFIGMIQPRAQSEIHPPNGPAIDPGYLRASAQAHDEGGFDQILIGWFSNGPDGLQIAAHAGAHTKRVGFLVAHRPGFQSPTTAARAFATLEPSTSPATRDATATAPCATSAMPCTPSPTRRGDSPPRRSSAAWMTA